jgi:hypothetical protein
MNWSVYPYWWEGTILRAFCTSSLWQIDQILYLLFRKQKADLQLLLRMQECKFITLSQYTGVIWLSMEGWDTHSSALGIQTQQVPPLRQAPNCCWGEG